MAKSHPSQQKCLLNSVLSADHYLKTVPNLKYTTENVLIREILSARNAIKHSLALPNLITTNKHIKHPSVKAVESQSLELL